MSLGEGVNSEGSGRRFSSAFSSHEPSLFTLFVFPSPKEGLLSVQPTRAAKALDGKDKAEEERKGVESMERLGVHTSSAAFLMQTLGLLFPPSSTAFSLVPRAACCFTLHCAPQGSFSPARSKPLQRASEKRSLQRQGAVALPAKMGVLRVLTPETIPVDCSEPVDPKALETAQAVIKSLRSAFCSVRIRHQLCNSQGRECVCWPFMSSQASCWSMLRAYGHG